MPKVTVALITYNRPQYLGKAIDAVVRQSYPHFEFLICDNGSDPETQEIIGRYSDTRIKVVRNEVNERDFYNLPFRQAAGDYLVITHDDDIMHPDLLLKEVAVLDQQPDVVAVGCNIANIGTDDQVINPKVIGINRDLVYHQNQYLHHFLQCRHLTCPNVLMRRSFFVEHNLQLDFSVGPGADTFMWHKASEFPVKMVMLNEVLYHYRVHTQQDSNLNRFSLYKQLYENLLLDIEGKPQFDQEREDILLRMMYDNYSMLHLGLIELDEYRTNLKRIRRDNKPGLKVSSKLQVYEKGPRLIKAMLAFRRFLNAAS